MANHIYKCNNCNIYTLNKVCHICKQPTLNPKPAKFSVEDKYGEYRRKAKLQHDLENKETD